MRSLYTEGKKDGEMGVKDNEPEDMSVVSMHRTTKSGYAISDYLIKRSVHFVSNLDTSY